jgi:hypothetical protein
MKTGALPKLSNFGKAAVLYLLLSVKESTESCKTLQNKHM